MVRAVVEVVHDIAASGPEAQETTQFGAVAYAWYLGSSASHLYLQQITNLNSVNFNTALVTSTQDFVALAATDYSALSSGTGQYSFDGKNGVRLDYTREQFQDKGGDANVWAVSYVRKF